MHKCSRCEYNLHNYGDLPLCPLHDKVLLEFNPELLEGAIKRCTPEEVRAPRTWWTKKELIRVCNIGGATKGTIKLMEKIPLVDLKAILLKYMGQEPRGRYTEIWQKPQNEWEQVRRTAMYGIRWEQIEEWNKATKRICLTCRYLKYEGPAEWGEVYSCILDKPWCMYDCKVKEHHCKRWKPVEITY